MSKNVCENKFAKLFGINLNPIKVNKPSAKPTFEMNGPRIIIQSTTPSTSNMNVYHKSLFYNPFTNKSVVKNVNEDGKTKLKKKNFIQRFTLGLRK